MTATLDVVDHWTGPGRSDAVITTPPLSENGAHPQSRRGAFEHWYFDARLDSGHTIVGFLQTAELITKRPGVELHVYYPDGRRREIRRPYKRALVSAAEDRFDVRVGENWGRVEPRNGALPAHRIHIAEDDIAFDLLFESEVPTWKPGEGRTSYGDDAFFAWVVGAPRARVSGTVRVGSEVIEASGIGYHDHNWGIGSMARIVDHWYWGRVYADDMTLVYANVFTRPRYGRKASCPLMLAADQRVVASTGEVEVLEGTKVWSPVARQHYPATLGLRAEGVELDLEVREIIHAHDLLSDVPVLGARPLRPLVNRVLGQPGYFRFRSDYEIRAVVDGEPQVRRGSTLHEMVALR